MTSFQIIAGLTDDEMMAKRPPRTLGEVGEKRIMVLYMCYTKGIKICVLSRLYGFHRNSIRNSVHKCRDLYETDSNFRNEFNRIFIAKW